ncbi:MAG: undecaprenyldiphospho-muramoylpentapeptide beta-N-acetylglucosaminyltransferase [Candidatus Omnitrophica bacterium]|nr:undecaprenyldiphospho-muramoylpentapeptide beta-N-acetylglucosaminyltransferase [Candidatus Omnitrophota bacterium]
MKKILIATGGTGGHIYPALVTGEELKRLGHGVMFIGVLSGSADKLKSQGFAVKEITAKGFVAKSPWEVVTAFFCLLKAFGDCTGTVLDFKPDVVLGFGGYSSFPTVFVSWLLGRKTMIHEQNAFPGEANKFLARIVNCVCVGFKDATRFFPPKKTVWTGIPFRSMGLNINREEALKKFGLDPLKKTVLVFGGSQGSRRLNDCVIEVITKFSEKPGFQVVHAAGRKDFLRVREVCGSIKEGYALKEYIENMDEAYAASDLVVARSGAGTVTELGILGKLSIMIPYPGAKNHQVYNARVLERLKMALIIDEKDLSASILRDKILILLNRNVSQTNVRESLKDEFLPEAVKRLAGEVVRFTDG